MVSSARNAPSRIVVMDGQQQHRRDLDVAADPGTEQAQPERREEARVDAGTAGCATGRAGVRCSRPASRPGCAPGTCPSRTPIDSRRTLAATSTPNTTPGDEGRRDEHQERAAGGVCQRRRPADRQGDEHRPPHSARPPAAATAAPTTPRRPRPSAVRAGGRSGGHQACVDPSRWAGEPAQYCPAATRPKTAEPGAISARLPIRVPGSRVLRAPTELSAPMRIAPTRSVSPSIQ